MHFLRLLRLQNLRLCLLLAVVMLLPGVSQAQDAPFVALYSVGTQHGEMSMFLPMGWAFIDDIAASGAVTFGETDAIAQRYLNGSKQAGSSEAIAGAGGIIQFYRLSDFDLTEAAVPDDLIPILEEFLTRLEESGYKTIQPPQTVTLRAGNGAYAITENAQESAFVMFMRYGNLIAYISAGTPPDSFSAAAGRLIAIVESVRVPGEIMMAVPELSQVMLSVSDQYSMRIPAGWTFSRIVGVAMSDSLVFGSRWKVFDGLAATVQENGSRNLTDAGIGGYIGIVSARRMAENNLDAERLYETLSDSLAGMSQAKSRKWTINGLEGEGILYSGYEPVSGRNDGAMLGVTAGLMKLENGDLFRLMLWVNPSHDVRRSQAPVDAIVASLQFPPEEGGQYANFGTLARETPTPFDTGAQTPAEDGTVPYVSTGQLISLRLPAGWFVRDLLDTDFNMLAFGSTETAAVDRQEVGRGEALGGSIFILPYSNSRIPAYPNDTQLIGVLTKWFEDTGAEMVKAPQVISTPNGKRVVYAVYHQTFEGLQKEEWGFVSLHDFGAQFLFVKVNADSKELFDANSVMLGAINDSIMMPAVLPE